MEEAVLKDLERVYSKVVEKFPGIKKEELKLKYSFDFEYVCFLMVDDKKYLEENKIVIDPSIIAGPGFLKFSEEEKEASIVHELGHYTRDKNSSPKKIRQTVFYNFILNAYASNPAMWLLEECHKMKRVKKWCFMKEVYADNKVIESGYGNVLLSILTKHLDRYSMVLAPVQKDELNTRIKNLEEKLKQE